MFLLPSSNEGRIARIPVLGPVEYGVPIPQADGLGSITSLTNFAGAVAASYRYDGYGNQLSTPGSIFNPFLYTAREWDNETGVYYYRARYYDASIGRFISEDPARFEASSDFYDYTDNSPVNWTDPEGLEKAQVCCRSLNRFASGPVHPLGLWHHCYIKFINDDGSLDTFGVLGNPKGTASQKPRHGHTERPTPLDPFPKGNEDDGTPDRDTGGHCKDLPAGECLKKLRQGLQKAVNAGSCPSCGANYHNWWWKFDGNNSNTFIFNMLQGAGITPPTERNAPGYHSASGKWY
jgi:RHS repeat-associated protein